MGKPIAPYTAIARKPSICNLSLLATAVHIPMAVMLKITLHDSAGELRFRLDVYKRQHT